MSARHYSAKKTIDILNKAVTSYPGFVDTQLSHIADLIENEAQTNARKRTGRMSQMTTKKKITRGGNVGYEVSGTADYTIYVHSKYPYIEEAFNKYSPMVKKIDFKKLFSGGSGFSSGW
jgi:hypothetical protein